MKQYIYRWNNDEGIREVLVFDNNELLATVKVPQTEETLHTLEETYLSGDFISSNKGTENDKRYGIRPIRLMYQHFRIEEDYDGEYILRQGMTWDDGFERTFTMEDDGVIKIMTKTKYWRHPERVETSYYDCDLKSEYFDREDKYIKKKKLIHNLNKWSKEYERKNSGIRK